MTKTKLAQVVSRLTLRALHRCEKPKTHPASYATRSYVVPTDAERRAAWLARLNPPSKTEH